MQWWRIVIYAVALLGVIAFIYQYIKMRKFLKDAENKTVEQAEVQILRYYRNMTIIACINSVLVLAIIILQLAGYLGELGEYFAGRI